MQQWQVRDVMTGRVVTAAADTPVTQIARLLAVHRLSTVPIVDDDHRILGVVSESDLRPGVAAATARAVMSARPVTVPADAPLSVAARKMQHGNVDRLLVTGADGRLLGSVSRADVLRPLTRPHTAIRDDVVEQVLRRALWIDPGRVRVDVHDGVVTLTGTVDRRTTAAVAARLAGHVPGVTAVVDRLRFEVDDTTPARSRAEPFPPQRPARPAA